MFYKATKTDKLAQQKRAILELVNVADAKTTLPYFFSPTFMVLLKQAQQRSIKLVQTKIGKQIFVLKYSRGDKGLKNVRILKCQLI